MTRLRDLDVAWFERERDPFLTHDFVAGYYHYLDLLEHAVAALRDIEAMHLVAPYSRVARQTLDAEVGGEAPPDRGVA